jgi:uncharacterized repeat protein (TIGR01451 family)
MQNSTFRSILLMCLLCTVLMTARAQYVSIPDSNFGKWLYTNGYSTSMTGSSSSGWQLDTSSSFVVNNNYMDCHTANIHDLTGIRYFKHLDTLKCYNNSLATLPSLPLPILYLDCSGNQLTGIPATPLAQKIICDSNQLTGLPALPASLRFLYCSGNHISQLPELPPSLQILYCDHNQLSTLPALPHSLAVLYCNNNQLASLPSLPSTLYNLVCSYNQLTSLPPIPAQLQDLECVNNPALSCLPYIFQNQVYIFKISGTNIHCLPDRFTSTVYDVNPAGMSICAANSGCDFFYNVIGNVHVDTMPSCLMDSLYPGMPVNGIKLRLKRSGQVIKQFYTSPTGSFSFKTDSFANYTLDIDTSDLSVPVLCPSAGQYAFTISHVDSVLRGANFGLVCSSDVPDYSVKSVVSPLRHPFRHGIITPILVDAGNTALMKSHFSCDTAVGGIVTTTYSGSVSYAGPAPGALVPTSVSGQTLTYQIADLNALRTGNLDIGFATDSLAVIGDSVCFSVVIRILGRDKIVYNDTIRICFEIHDPHDPNLKEVYPLDTMQSGDWLTYTIHFQNTGNDTAYTVVVRDTLSQNVDAASFQYLGSSHKAVIQLSGSAMEFTFPRINLVDSATNPPLSEGWIQYKVRSKSNLPLLTQIKNTAYIYFDNTPAIVTNTTVNTVDTVAAPLGIARITDGSSLYLYPNPNTGTFTLLTTGTTHSDYTITDMLGAVIEQKPITTDKQSIDLNTAPAGVYTLSVKGSQPLRFVIVR